MLPEYSTKVLSDPIKNIHFEPLVLCKGWILDGRNRYAVGKQAGVKPRFVDYEGDDPIGYVFSLNLHRRYLDESQWAMAATKIANMKVGDNQHASIEATSQGQAAELMKVSRSAVQRAHKVEEGGAQESQ